MNEEEKKEPNAYNVLEKPTVMKRKKEKGQQRQLSQIICICENTTALSSFKPKQQLSTKRDRKRKRERVRKEECKRRSIKNEILSCNTQIYVCIYSLSHIRNLVCLFAFFLSSFFFFFPIPIPFHSSFYCSLCFISAFHEHMFFPCRQY